ncbi:proline dehydrogenase family protein [Candidatus Blastococcus massiliensis]|uniref:proline dehydrogenase family protein n=1 Tax=Candidatus Blastococcus massiliensis TaxID=1470358 RepID=UPI0004BC77F3|nr:proline dehydrogenase family protein [Candidatus Blastococcus massiliensis]
MISALLDRASRSSRSRHLVETFPLTRRVVDRFVAGETSRDAVEVAAALAASGMRVSIDVLGEDVVDGGGARRTGQAYVDLLQLLDERGLASGADVSLKLSALGRALPQGGEAMAAEHAHGICEVAASVGSTVTLDMEDHTTVDSTLRIGEQLRATFPWVATVLQSNLRRTDGDIAAVADPPARVRLVKGAYREPGTVAHERKRDVDRAYARQIEALMASGCHPMIATHDPAMLEHARASAARHGRAPGDWEVQMLFGVRTDLQRQVRDRGDTMRVYVPFGTDWYGYLMRRLAERPANVVFFLRALAGR